MSTIEENAISYIEQFNYSTDTEVRKTALQNLAQLLSGQHRANELFPVLKQIDGFVPVLVSIMKDKNESASLKESIFRFFKKNTAYSEVYQGLKEIFLQCIDENYLSIHACEEMMQYNDKLEESKEFFIEALSSEKECIRLLAVKAISIWPQTRQEWDYTFLFSWVVKEDKSLIIRDLAWHRLEGKDQITNKLIPFLLEDILPSSLYDVLIKFQPDIQVPLTRIIELTKDIPYQKIKALSTKVREDQIVIPIVRYEEAIKGLVKSGQIVGEYFELEQVFVRKKSNEQLIKPVSFSKEYICYFCGNPIEVDAKICPSCQNNVIHCNVCKLPITFGQEVGKCSFCEVKGHLTHFQEWVKIKGICPNCKKKLPVEGIVPVSGVEVKK